MIKRADQQVVKLRLGMVRLDRGFQQLATIGGKQRAGVTSAETLTPMPDGNLPQRVKLSTSRSRECDFAAEKKVNLPCERTFWSPRPLGHGFYQSMLLGEPMHDQTGLSESGQADDGGFRGLHAATFVEFLKIGDTQPENPRGEIHLSGPLP